MASLAKRQAAREAAVQVEDASAARPATKPFVGVFLTPFAPRCDGAPLSSPIRRAQFWGRTPGAVVRATLDRCNLNPRTVTVEAEVNGDVTLLAPVRPERLRLVSAKSSEPAPFAVFWDGLTEEEVRQAVADLADAHWLPKSAVEAVH